MKKTNFLLAFIVSISTCVGQNVDSALAYYQMGVAEKEAKHYLVAASYFDKALAFDTSFIKAYEANGYVNLEMHKTDAALRNFTKLYQADTSSKTAIKELTDLYYSYHQYAKAILFARRCTDCANAERIIAMSSYKQEDYGTAVKSLLNIVAKDSLDAEATYTIGRSYLDMEEYLKAVPYYDKAVQLDTSKNSWMNELGLLYYNLNNFKKAKESFLNAAAHGYPLNNDFNENLGYACIFSGEFEKGEAMLLAILEKKPGNKDILRDIAEAYYKQKMYDKSLDFCSRLLKLDDKDGKALYQAGLCFQKKGDKQKGESMCDAAIKLDPSLSGLRTKMDQGMGL